MENNIGHATERKAFEVALTAAMKKAQKNENGGYVDLVNMLQKLLGKTWPDEAYDHLRTAFGKDGKYTQFFNRITNSVDQNYMKKLFMSVVYEGIICGYRNTQKMGKKLSVHIPWIILFDPTSACNLHCTGCWASEYSRQLNLSNEDMDKLVSEAKKLGIHSFVMTGGEPMTRKNDILKLAKKHSDCGFMIFTNGTLVDQAFCDGMKECGNIIFSISIEGDEKATDARRGAGTFAQIMKAMDLLRENRIPYGTSICYTSANCEAVTSDEFYDFLISKGVLFSWYFHFMPVGKDTDLTLCPTVEQRKYMYNRIREIRGYEGGKQIYCMDFQNDGQFVGGCVAGGKYYCHINPAGDMEPCVFIHYSNANIHDKSLLECLKQPLFREYQANQPFNANHLRPCPMLENPEKIAKMVHVSGAHSTDMTDPEDVDELEAKIKPYAEKWQVEADKLWASDTKRAK